MIHIDDFDLDIYDAVPALIEAIRKAKSTGDKVITFPKGEYHFWDTYAQERLIAVSNNIAPYLGRIAFLLEGFDGLVIDGNGSDFVFHGKMSPFVISKCKNITIKNVNIDCKFSMHTAAEVITSTPERVELKMIDPPPHYIRDNRIIFEAEGWKEELPPYCIINMNPKTKAPQFDSGDSGIGCSIYSCTVSEPEQDVLRFDGDIKRLPELGNILILRYGDRYCSSIFIEDSENIMLENINIYKAMGMGVIGQYSRDIYLNNVNVRLKDNDKECYTALADALHFAGCAGKLEVLNCLLENQMDDPLNVHGIYMKFVKNLSSNRILAAAGCFAGQDGFAKVHVDDSIRGLKKGTIDEIWKANVEKVEELNSKYFIITTDRPVNGSEGDGIENLFWYPDVLVSGCTMRSNRARGILMSTSGKAVIENNIFSIPGAAILIDGADFDFWFESGPVTDVTIRNNLFDNCRYCPSWGRAVFDIGGSRLNVGFHKNIKIIDNEIRTFDDRIICANNVDGLTCTGNKVIKTDAYPDTYAGPAFELGNCINCNIEEY